MQERKVGTNRQSENNEFDREFDWFRKEIEKTPRLSELVKQFSREKGKQSRYNILLYMQSQALTGFFGVDIPEYRRALHRALRSRETHQIFFLDILGAYAWANPVFHSYLYEQIPAYIERNRTDIWNLVIQDDLIKDKIEGRVAKWIDIDDVMPGYNSGDVIDLNMVRILSWSDDDMKSDVAQDLIELHRAFSIPLFYLPYDNLSIMLDYKKVEFHLALDKDGKCLPGGCWVYDEARGKREPYKKDMLPQEPEKLIRNILQHHNCVFALERRTQLCQGPDR